MNELKFHYNAEKKEATISPIKPDRLINLVEVTRCKNCIACTSFDEYGIGWCMEHDTYIYEKDFCSYGKEKKRTKAIV